MTVFFMRSFLSDAGTWSDPSIKQLPYLRLPLLDSIPVLGALLSGHNIIVYLSWLATIALQVFLFRTKGGSRLRAVGESPEAARAAGIDVDGWKALALMTSGALASLGGAFLSIGHLTLFTRNMSNNRGFVAFSASLFGLDNPIAVFFASLLFGSADAVAMRLQAVTNIPPSLVQFFPNLMTIAALIIIALRVRSSESIARMRFRSRMRRERAESLPKEAAE
jgi:general nucleoside transport system permease protein